MPSPDRSPFGPELQRYWDLRHEYFARFDEGIRIDAEGLYSVMPEDAALALARASSGASVLDGFAGVGGSAIAFARAGRSVTAVELDPSRLAMARHNAAIYGVPIDFVAGDVLELVDRVEADSVFLDPPWGGPSYSRLDRFALEHFAPDGARLLEATLPRFREVILRVPLNFDLGELDRFDTPYELRDDVSHGRLISRTVLLRS